MLLAGALSLAPLAARPPRTARPWSELEAGKATISRIDVEVTDVFDLKKPDEDIWLGRLANRLHASTREAVIRRTLLFAEGDRVRSRRIYETERLLRALPFLKDARIDPVVEPGGAIVARVRVRDAWTTQVSAGFSSVGGQKSMNLGVDEMNLLGQGKSLGVDVAKDHERTAWGITYMDPQVLGSRWRLMLQNRYLSDGSARAFTLERPFFALDTPWSTSVSMAQKRTSIYLYDQGVQAFQAPFVQDQVRWVGEGAFHLTEDRVWRAGLLLDRQDTHYGDITESGTGGSLRAPTLVNRRLRGVGLTLSTQEDAFDTFQDLQGMDTPEDYNMAWIGRLEAGAYLRGLGSTVAAPFFRIQVSSGWSSAPENLSLFTMAVSGRLPRTGLENGQFNASMVQYLKLTPHQVLAGLVAVDVGRRLDPENWYYLGGDQGMRGYPNFLHPGDARWLVSCDYRLLTEQRWWGIVRLGFNAFVDAGGVRQLDGQGWSKVYSDVGVGLRLGNLKSSLGRVILFSVAMPLNREPYQSRVQFTIGNTMRF